jgi:Domain of unknown function (DUF397)
MERKIMIRRWRKSSYTGTNGNCVELAHTGDLIRDSKNPGPTLRADVTALLATIKANQLV